MDITKVYPLDAVFDNLDEVPEDVKMKGLVFFSCFSRQNLYPHADSLFFFFRKFV